MFAISQTIKNKEPRNYSTGMHSWWSARADSNTSCQVTSMLSLTKKQRKSP